MLLATKFHSPMKRIPLLFLPIALFLFSQLAFAQTGSTVPLEAPIGSASSINLSGGAIVNYTRILFAYAGGIVGSIALLVIIASGIEIMVSSGDLSKAKTRLMGALAGLLLLATGGWLLYELNPCFFTFQESPACTPRS